jgi:hypothetical protein
VSSNDYDPEVYKRLAATGKYYNTGKVLIGLLRNPPRQYPTSSEETMQGILLGVRSYGLYPRWMLKAVGILLASLVLLCMMLSAL